jgi:hypothetical protein
MAPRPLELNALGTGAAQWWEIMDSRPVVRKIFLGLVVALILGLIYFLFLPDNFR